ncbi:MAG: ComF family protein [Candidatus Omnitrophota bacterium]|nr:ComF family protein [Candidatus Omnitrophota bacterium]
MFPGVWQGFQQLVFPDHCALCRAFLNDGRHKQLCDVCRASIPFNVPPFCRLCPRRLEIFTPDGICPACAARSPSYDAGWSACLYDESMRRLLHAFKYSGKTRLAPAFAQVLNAFIDTYHIPLNRFDFCVPVPLHPARLRERGFNQSEILCGVLRGRYGLACRGDILARTRSTEPQAALGAKERWTNLEGAFRINHSDAVADKSVLIVDDLFTTGATAEAASRALKEAGAAYAGILTLAITSITPSK